jgi:hypothetical protein
MRLRSPRRPSLPRPRPLRVPSSSPLVGEGRAGGSPPTTSPARGDPATAPLSPPSPAPLIADSTRSTPLSPPGRGAGGEGSPAATPANPIAGGPPCSPLVTRHSSLIVPAGKKLGGIDFGYRNPFAAVWGIWDRDGVLWLVGEHYCRQQPPSYHATKLPRDVTWYADPSGASDISELNYNGFVVRKGYNNLRTGIAAVNARIADGLLKIVDGACPNLLYEASLYRYGADPEDQKSECPSAGPDHALDALRYLISRLDAGRRRRPNAGPPGTPPDGSPPPSKPRRPWLSIYNEALWTPLY